MQDFILIVPNDGVPNNWFKFINNGIQLLEFCSEDLILTIDFNNVRFLDTDDIVLLACLIELFKEKKCKITFINGNRHLNNHLKGIKFKKYWEDGFKRDNFTITHNRQTLGLWKISESMVPQYSIYANKFYESNFMNGKDLISFSSNLSEIFNNIFDHSQSRINGYIITQYKKSINKLSFSVCDFGVGIPESLNNYFKNNNLERLSDSNTIRKSLEFGTSAFSTEKNRGFGLSYVLDFIQGFDGKLSIYSNNGHLYKEYDNDFFLMETNYNFKGTLIKVEIDTTKFDILDEDEYIHNL